MEADLQVLLYFGGTKMLKDLNRGDILITHDARTKIVMQNKLITYTDETYMICPETSKHFAVSRMHPITIMNKLTNEIVDVPAWECFSELLSRTHTLYSVPIRYAATPTKNDPYLIGMIIGGNVSTKSFHSVVKDYLMKRLDNIQRGIIEVREKNDLSQMNQDEIRDLLTNRFIPNEYLYNTEATRMKLLQGIVSPMRVPENGHSRSRSISPGRNNGKKITRSKSMSRIKAPDLRGKSKIPVLKKNITTIEVHDQNLSNQIVFLAKSLGYNVIYDECEGEITIFGNIGQLANNGPTRVPFKIKKLMNVAPKEFAQIECDTADKRVALSSCLIFCV